MLSPQEFLAQWGNRYELATYDPVAVRELAIPESSRDFLIQAGLPLVSAFNKKHDKLPTLGEAFANKYNIAPECRCLRVLGVHERNGIIMNFWCLDENQSGIVLDVRPPFRGSHYVARFVNSSVQLFAEFWLLKFKIDDWQDTHELPDGCSEEEYEAHIESRDRISLEVTQKMRAIDPEVSQRVDWIMANSDQFYVDAYNPVRSCYWYETIASLEGMGIFNFLNNSRYAGGHLVPRHDGMNSFAVEPTATCPLDTKQKLRDLLSYCPKDRWRNAL